MFLCKQTEDVPGLLLSVRKESASKKLPRCLLLKNSKKYFFTLLDKELSKELETTLLPVLLIPEVVQMLSEYARPDAVSYSQIPQCELRAWLYRPVRWVPCTGPVRMKGFF